MRPSRPQQRTGRARLRPRAAARRLRRDRDGAVGLRCPAGAAAGDRPQVVRRDGGRRGHGPGRAARRARGDPGPQRRAAGRLGRRDDGRRGPVAHRGAGAGAGEVPRRPPRRRLLRHPRAAAHRGQPLRVHRAPGALQQGHRDRGGGPLGRLQRPGAAPRPGARLPGRRRRRQPDRLPRHRRGARRLRAHLRRPAGRQGRLVHLRDRRRQPPAAGRQHDQEARQRPRPAHHHRPRPAVVHPASPAPDRRGRRRRLRRGGRDGQPHRRAPGPGRRPDVRRQRAGGVAEGGPRLARDERRLRARARSRRCSR